jgi:hypothetical protein
MQNRGELRQKGHDGRQKTTCRERGEKYIISRGGGGGDIILDRNIDPCQLVDSKPVLCIRNYYFPDPDPTLTLISDPDPACL